MVHTRLLMTGCAGVILVVGGCSNSQDVEEAGMPNDAAPLADAGPLTPAVGGGYCCPYYEGPNWTCGCLRIGGWVATNDLSSCPRTCDMAPPLSIKTDSHGCEVQTGAGSCAYVPRPDAAVDAAPADAAPDTPSDADSDGE
jgi:hypothetical protein